MCKRLESVWGRRSKYPLLLLLLLFYTATVESVHSLRYAEKDTQIVRHQVPV